MVEQGPTEDRADDDGESEGLDIEQLREVVGFALRALRRRRLLTSAVFVVVAALGITVSVTMPRSYRAEFRLLAQRNNAIRALSSVNAQGLDAADNPTKDVAALITRRDNLVTLVRDANLVERFERLRSAPLKLKDTVMAFIFGRPTADDKELAQIYTLGKRLAVNTTSDTVDVTVDWSDARTAFDLAMLVEKNFLEARYDDDVAVIKDGITVLEDHAKSELEQVDVALDKYQKLVSERAPRAASSSAPRAAAARAPFAFAPRAAAKAAGGAEIDPDLPRELEDKRAQIKTLEDNQQRTLDALRRQLVEAQLTLTPMHPTVVALQQQVDAQSQPSPELVQLRSEERALMAQLAVAQGTQGEGAASAAPRPAPLPRVAVAAATVALDAAAPAPSALPLELLDRDGILQLGQSKLTAAARAYEDTMARIDAANVELEITRTSYKHRYTVLVPPELPRKPKKPIAQLIGVGSVVGAALLALLVAAGADLASGAVIESRQMQRRLKLEELGELDVPAESPARTIDRDEGNDARLSAAPEGRAPLALRQGDPPWAWDDVSLQKLWLALERKNWRSLAIVGASAGMDTLRIAELIAQLAWRYRGEPSTVYDLRDLSMRLVDYQVGEMRAHIASGTRIVIALRAISENPTSAPIAQSADAVVVCVALGRTDFRSAEQTIAAIGRGRVVGAVVFRRAS